MKEVFRRIFSSSLTFAYHYLIKLILITPLNTEKVITISVFYENLSPTMYISNISGEILFEKKKTIFTKNDELLKLLPPSNFTFYQ